MRVAWFSPLPPDRSGIAAYSAELLPGLADAHDIDAFVDDGDAGTGADAATEIPGVRVLGAHDFPWRHFRRPYDVTVYQLGNNLCHDYMWPYLVRYPGLVTLHDAQLHQARARGLLRRLRHADYRNEFRYSHPEVNAGAAELVISGLCQSVFYLWPMTRIPIEASRAVGVHNAWLARELSGAYPGRTILHIHQGVPDVLAATGAPAAEVRRRHRIPDDAVVFGAFGRVTPEKSLSKVLSAMAQVARDLPNLWLLVVGDIPPYYDLAREARYLGIADRVQITGYVADEALAEYLRAVDVCVNLRWPTSRETSAAWLRCLSAGRPTIITDLAHLGDLPALDLRSMKVVTTGDEAAAPVCASIDLMDEVQMIRLAWRHLGSDPALRDRLGRAARRYWEQEATLDRMVRDYARALRATRAGAAAPPPAEWPAHLSEDGTSRARSLAGALGVSLDWLARKPADAGKT